MRDSTQHWQKILAEGFSSTDELLQFLNLPNTPNSGLAEKTFKTRVPRGFARRMEPGNPFDPLLRQVLASPEELNEQPGFEKDPLDESSSNLIEGLIHKYNGRVLLTITGSCAINCRYCFRRHFPYNKNNPGRQGWENALSYIAGDAGIKEVIFSGGDPLLASDTLIQYLYERLANIPHVNTIRIHTRIPIVLPERIQDSLLKILKHPRIKTVVVVHSNHPHELSDEVKAASQALRQAECHLLNQSVLLRGVNDDAKTLASLSEQLFAMDILPYYLHLLDKVQGAHHFDVSLKQAQMIYRDLQTILPGYLVPRLVKEIPGEKNKTLCSVNFFANTTE